MATAEMERVFYGVFGVRILKGDDSYLHLLLDSNNVIALWSGKMPNSENK